MSSSYQSRARFEQEILSRLGILPNLFLAAPAAPEVSQRFWQGCQDDYLDNALPSLFKERLVVYLSRFCNARYPLLRHAGFLLGQGYPAGDSGATPQGMEQLIALLRYPAPSLDNLQAALRLLHATPAGQQQLPGHGDALEQAVLVCCGALYLQPGSNQRARDGLCHLLGRQWSEQILCLISYVGKMHLWVCLHPEIAIEPDLKALQDQHPELAQLLQPEAPPQDAAEPAVAVPVPGAAPAAASRVLQQEYLVSMLSHELRTPVAAISAVSDMFQIIGLPDERLRGAGNILQRQIEILGRSLDRLSELSEFMAGTALLTHAAIPAADALDPALHRLQALLQEKGITVDAQASDPSLVRADRQRLEQLFESLLAHAAKLGKSASSLRIVMAADGARLGITFSLGQSGAADPASPGASSDRHAGPEQSAGFSPSAHRSSGLSLHLALASVIADLHGGELQTGTTGNEMAFRLLLPLAGADSAPPAGDPASAAAPAQAQARDKERLRVLAIEDNRDFAQLFRHMLEIMGCDLEITSDARSGMRLARDIQPQLIFCDIGLPGDMDGIDFARSLRADSALAHIPLVAVSGYNSPADVKRAMEAGFDRVCGKPVKFADISAALATFATGGRTHR